MINVHLDTNFLIDIVKFRIDLNEIDNLILEPCQLYTLDKVVDELKKIKNRNSMAALRLIGVKKIRIIRIKEKNVDKAMLSLADKDTIVATNDSKLRKQLKLKGIRTIFIKSRKQLGID